MNTNDSLILLWLTHPFGVVEVSFHDPAGFAVTVADAAPVFFCRGTDDAVTADFLQEVEQENKKTQKNWLTLKFLGSNGLYLEDTVISIDYFIYKVIGQKWEKYFVIL